MLMSFVSFFGVNSFRSFWSNIERGEGLLTLYHLFVFFVLLSAFFRTKKDWLRYFDVSIVISLIVSFYALFQKFGFSFVIDSGNRVFSTLGNPTYVAAYLIFHIFFCLLFFYWKPQLKWRLYYSFVFLFEIFILLNTQTRGALLGLSIGFLLFGLLLVFFSDNKKLKKSSFVAIVFFILLTGGLWVLRDQTWVKNIPGIGRAVTASLDNASIENRLMSWNSAVKGWKDRPVFGYGYGNFNIAFNKHFNPEMYRDVGSVIWFDRAHNTLLDQLVYGGILGTVFYLAIFAYAVWLLWLRKKQAKDFEGIFVFIVLTSLLAAYFIQNLFVFDCLVTYIMFYSLLAFVAFQDELREKSEISKDEGQKDKLHKNKETYSAPNALMIIVFVLIFILSIYFFNLRLMKQNNLCIQAIKYANAGKLEKSEKAFKEALSKETSQVFEIRQHLVQTTQKILNSNKVSSKTKKEFCNLAISEIKKNSEFAPDDAYAYLFLSNAYNMCSRFDPQRAQLAIRAGEKGLENSPTRPQFYYQMSRAALNIGRYQDSIDYAKKSIELNPDVHESHWRLLTSYVFAGKKEKAEEEIENMKSLGVDFEKRKNLDRLTQIYFTKKDYEKVASLIRKMIEEDPKEAKLYAQLAFIYQKMDNQSKTIEALEKAAEIDSKYKNQLEEVRSNINKTEKDDS